MKNTQFSRSRRRVVGYAAATVGAVVGGLRTTPALAQSGANTLSAGLLRAPASAIVDLTEQHGWFKEAGLQLNSVLFAQAAGPKVIQALGGGSIGVSFVNSTPALLGMAGGAMPLRFISICTDPSRLFALLAQPGIDSVPKLAGKRVACTAGTGLQYFLARILSKFGMTLRDIEMINLPAAEGQAAFVADRVDAVVPSVNGRFSIMGTKKDAREIFTYADFTKGPGSTEPFLNYDLWVTTEPVLQANRAALQAFLTAYHDRGVPYLLNPGTRKDALKRVTEYVNTEQKNPTDATIMTRIMDDSGFYDRRTVKQLMTRADFRANLEAQVKFFMDLGQIKSAPDLGKAIVTDLL